MEPARVVDMGRHAELLARQGLYAKLFTTGSPGSWNSNGAVRGKTPDAAGYFSSLATSVLGGSRPAACG